MWWIPTGCSHRPSRSRVTAVLCAAAFALAGAAGWREEPSRRRPGSHSGPAHVLTSDCCMLQNSAGPDDHNIAMQHRGKQEQAGRQKIMDKDWP